MTSGRNPQIYVRTGLPDDPRRPLSEDNGPLYWAARDVHDRQDDWTPQEHGAAWTVLLAVWPLAPGRPPTRDALSRSAALLDGDGIDPAAALNVSADTLREREHADRERPSVRRGEDLLRADPLGVAMQRSVGGLWVPQEAGPRVYLDGEDEPDLSYFNPLATVVEGAHRVSATAEQYDALASDARRARWVESHPPVTTFVTTRLN